VISQFSSLISHLCSLTHSSPPLPSLHPSPPSTLPPSFPSSFQDGIETSTPHVDLVVASGHGAHSALTVFHEGVRERVLSTFPLPAAVEGCWSLRCVFVVWIRESGIRHQNLQKETHRALSKTFRLCYYKILDIRVEHHDE
jgi:hypothetical protein